MEAQAKTKAHGEHMAVANRDQGTPQGQSRAGQNAENRLANVVSDPELITIYTKINKHNTGCYILVFSNSIMYIHLLFGMWKSGHQTR